MNKKTWYIIMVSLFILNLILSIVSYSGFNVFGMGWCSALIFVRLLEDGAN
jgi:hypothetical protein